MKTRQIFIIAIIMAAGMLWGVKEVHAATFTVTTNNPVTYTIRILYNSGCPVPSTSTLHDGQTIWNGGTLSYSGFPDGCYNFEITVWPSGWRLAGIDGVAPQQGGNVSWNVRWEPVYTLNVSRSGSGTVTGGNINCGSTCSATYNKDNAIGLNAYPDSGSTFAGWSGACTSSIAQGGCVIVMDSDKNVTATFNVIPKYTLSVSRSGTGSGTIAGGSINCGSVCSQTFNKGDVASVDAFPDSKSSFSNWSGACTSSIAQGGCVIVMDSDKSVVSAFTKKNPTVSISCSPSSIPYNSSANVSWSSKDTSNCTVSPTGWTGKSGSQSTGNLTSSQTYTVTCTSQ